MNSLALSKIRAALKHAIFTLIVALVSYVLVFHVMYPGTFSQMMPGAKLFILVLCVEVILGPMISLVIYNPAKGRSELLIDYTLVVAIQLSALAYGLSGVLDARPVYAVFVKDRIEIVAAADFTEDALLQSEDDSYQSLSWTGPNFVCTRPTESPAEREWLLFEEIPKGRDVQHLPLFYKECTDNEVWQSAFDFERLDFSDAEAELVEKIDRYKSDGLRWLPAHGSMGVWIAVIDTSTEMDGGRIIEYLPIDPYK